MEILTYHSIGGFLVGVILVLVFWLLTQLSQDEKDDRHAEELRFWHVTHWEHLYSDPESSGVC